MVLNKISLNSIPEKPISIGQLYKKDSDLFIVIKFEPPLDVREYIGLANLKTGEVNFTYDASLNDLEDLIEDLSKNHFEQVKESVTITPG